MNCSCAAVLPLLVSLALLGGIPLHAGPPSDSQKLIPPPEGAYFGAYMDFGETEDNVTLEKIGKFEKLAGKKPAIIASSSYWGEQTFPMENLQLIARHGAVPMVYWSPWDKPYEQIRGPDKFSLLEILAGKWDAYIDKWADSAKEFGHPFFVSFCNEMNGDWFPWSASFYGKGEAGVEVCKQAWRYVVDRVRARGATNILWVLHLNNYAATYVHEGEMAHFYPGPDYVDWLGLSVYGKQFREDGNWAFFKDLIDWPYTELSAIDPQKPIMLAEFGVGDFSKYGSKAQWVSDSLSMIARYPRIKAAIYWHERWQNEDCTFSNLRINSSQAVLAAFNKGLASPYWISRPIFTPKGSGLKDPN